MENTMDTMYNKIVMEHFTNPRNVGEIENADGVGTYGSPVCGDMTNIYIKVEDDRIVDAKFKTFGCGSAIASSSIALEMMIGKTIEEVLAISSDEIVKELGGLPTAKVHCSVLADKAIKSAILDYAQKTAKTYKGLEGFDPNVKDESEHE